MLETVLCPKIRLILSENSENQTRYELASSGNDIGDNLATNWTTNASKIRFAGSVANMSI